MNILLVLGVMKDFQNLKAMGKNTKGKSINLAQLLYISKRKHQNVKMHKKLEKHLKQMLQNANRVNV